MDELIKQIRSYLNLNQEELAKLLRVSFATVNRWENGHAVPGKLAQAALYELCQKKDIPVREMILNRVREAAKTIATGSERTILYHGSKSGISGSIQPKSRSRCDFGKGFYMGTEPEQALTLICDYDKSKFYIVSIDTEELEILDIPANLDWAMIVAYHRGRMDSIQGTSLYEKYYDMTRDKDLIVGSIADDRMFYVIDNFFIGNITDTALIHSLSALELGRQYVAVTQKACDAIRIECEISLSHLERQFLKDLANENRSKGVSFANEICRNYRREGLFFDEILEVAKREHPQEETK